MSVLPNGGSSCCWLCGWTRWKVGRAVLGAHSACFHFCHPAISSPGCLKVSVVLERCDSSKILTCEGSGSRNTFACHSFWVHLLKSFMFVSSCLLQATQECFMSSASAQMGGVLVLPKLCALCVPFPWQEMSEDQQISRVQMD